MRPCEQKCADQGWVAHPCDPVSKNVLAKAEDSGLALWARVASAIKASGLALWAQLAVVIKP